jgi:hypothetical protein
MFHSRGVRYTWGLSQVFADYVYVDLVFAGVVVLSWVSG